MLRAPIVTVLGHIDAGKTTLLDKIRGTAVAQKELGGITQHIGATEIPIEVVEKICREITKSFKVEIKITSLLFIDTPGHEAFTNLRKRGGSIADIAIIVVDVNEGIQKQTIEALEIVRSFKVPFFIALTKIDTIHGWKNNNTVCFSKSFEKQSDFTKIEFEKKLSQVITQLSNLGLRAELFSRVKDYEKVIPIVPCSGVTGEGIGELLLLIVGYAQKFLKDKLELDLEGRAEGNILEVKEEKGLGKTLNVILYRGKLRRGDLIVVGGVKGPVVTKVKAILRPVPLRDMREKCKFYEVEEVASACGIKITASNLENVVAGMPLMSCKESEVEKVKELIRKEVGEVMINLEQEGVIVKADTLGTLEAILKILREKGIRVKKAEIGDLNRNDVVEASEMRKKDPFLGVIFLFNVKAPKDLTALAENYGVKIFESKVIYKLVEDYEEWKERVVEEERKKILEKLTTPSKIRILPGYVFRQSKPAVVGVEVLAGKIRSGYRLMKESGKPIGVIKGIEHMGEPLEEAGEGEKVAISIDGAVIGRNVKEGEVLLSDMDEREYLTLEEKNLLKFLKDSELQVLDEILKIKRKKNPLWGFRA